jgi:hypothetical protein
MLPMGGLHVKHAVQRGIWVPTQHLGLQGELLTIQVVPPSKHISVTETNRSVFRETIATCCENRREHYVVAHLTENTSHRHYKT